jgi:hypothetical protein
VCEVTAGLLKDFVLRLSWAQNFLAEMPLRLPSACGRICRAILSETECLKPGATVAGFSLTNFGKFPASAGVRRLWSVWPAEPVSP